MPASLHALSAQVALRRGYPASSVTAWSYLVGACLLFPVAAAKFGMTAVLWGFAAVCGLAWLVVLLFVPETKGVALECALRSIMMEHHLVAKWSESSTRENKKEPLERLFSSA